MINILGINISTLSKKQIFKKIELFLSGSQQHQIVTPNPEFLLQASHDEEFFYILNKADLAVPDGIGLKFASWIMGRNVHRIIGADLVKDVLKMARDKKIKAVIINWENGLSKKENIKKALKEKYPDLQFVVLDIDRKISVGTRHGAFLRKFKPDVLFVTFGAPWQEKWIYHNLPKLSSVKLAIGVGGAFDFLTGKIKRAPKFLRILGLEWLWRLFKQPRRWKRIYNAVIIFPWKFFKWRFIRPFLYRPNVACLLYKRVIRLAAIPQYCGSDHANKIKGVKYKILLAERKDNSGHWQLPQGGTDGENLEIAGARELREEIGIDKFQYVKSFSNVYQYKFGDEKSRAGIKSKYIEGYKGQKQGLFIAEFAGKDKDIKINFWDHSNWKWVDSDDLTNEVHPVRREAVKIFLEKFNSIDKKKH